MEKDIVIEKFSEFLREYYYNELLTAYNENKKSVYIEFDLIDKFDTELADALLDNPQEVLEYAEQSLSQIDLPGEVKLRLRILHLSEETEIRIRNIRAEHIGKLISVDGFVRTASEVRPEVSEAIFQCPDCGERITVIQTERFVKAPFQCDKCDNTKGFKLIDQKLFDARWIKMEEPFEITTGERPSEIIVFLKEDLTSPKMRNKTDPGNRIQVVGVLKNLPKKGTSRQMDIFIDANSIESMEIGWEELDITPEDEKKIFEMTTDPNIYDKLIASVAPALYGMEPIKEAIVMQLFGGESHVQRDKSRVRGDIHILLVGDPSCLVGDERIVLGNGAIMKIASAGSHHLEKINLPIYLAEGHKRGFAKVFHKFKNHPIIEILSESGKSIKGTKNHPLLTKEGWKRLEEMKVGDEVRTISWIPCSIHKYIEFKPNSEIKIGSQSKKIKVPKVVDEKLGAVLGYLIADGYAQKYRIGCTFNYNELDLLPKIKCFFEELFGIVPRFDYHKEKYGTNVEMVFNSKSLATILSFVKEKRIPNLIFQSKNSVVASFLSWLYEGDGSIISGGRGKNGILYKAKDVELLRDIQILLLRFGIHSRIYGNNLMIRQGNSIFKFIQKIGFNSQKKKAKLLKLKSNIKKLSRKRHNKYWERIVKIAKHPATTVYDIEVPKYHKFVANGIVSHNTAKSAIMKVVSTLIPRGRYVSGKGVTGAGLTAAVVREEEFLGGWVLEAGVLVMCNRSLIAIDEFEKIEKTDQVALHEAMELQQISIAKANIVATLPAQTAVLGGGNPKFGRFDPYVPIKEQIDVPETLLTRFDLKFALRDIPNPDLDEKMAEHILQARHFDDVEIKPAIEGELLKKYVSYARKKCHPKLSKEAGQAVKDFYVGLREKTTTEESPVSITLRQYESLIRMAEASAKIQLRDVVTKEDAIRGINLMKASLREFGFDSETGQIDIDRVEGHTSSAERGKIRTMLDVIDELTATVGKNIPKEEIVRSAKNKGLKEFDIEKMLNELKNTGMLFEPRPNVLQKM